ncbi:hypothetical protein D8674_036857 [Pyrus ussuriensis x Pyrus communis]|uniref:Aminotransferase-like plant mobile domain-containing protein n=1 Tax=Pyrus ussuriensis x Pyrus communis TaxID=2448454 RepID=A0A5N5GAJ0_9ROSA|nr:hypothetical protein D8674_036857 [Pyrus ussuriensis x Pyrus communis]
MPKTKWFTTNLFLAESGISSSKWSQHRRGFPLMNDPAWIQWINKLEPMSKRKWMNNGIYELITLSKTTMAKPELLTTAFLFWNSGTNTFDFKMGPISPTILDMAQVFGLRPSGRIVDVTHDWAPYSRPTAKSLGSSTSLLQLEYNSTTFKSYGTSFKGFIPFVNKSFGADSLHANIDQENMELAWEVCSDRYKRELEFIIQIYAIGFRQAIPIPFFDSEEDADALILQEAATEAKRRAVGEGPSASKKPIIEFHQTPAFTFGKLLVLEIPLVSDVISPEASRAAPTIVPKASEVPLIMLIRASGKGSVSIIILTNAFTIKGLKGVIISAAHMSITSLPRPSSFSGSPSNSTWWRQLYFCRNVVF